MRIVGWDLLVYQYVFFSSVARNTDQFSVGRCSHSVSVRLDGLTVSATAYRTRLPADGLPECLCDFFYFFLGAF